MDESFESQHVQLVNNTDLVFIDISSEVSRTYRFPNGEYVTLDNPLKLHVSKSGGHRVFTADGNAHYIPSGWIHLCWKAKNGEPHFVK